MVRKGMAWVGQHCQSPGKHEAETQDLVSNPKQNAFCQKAEGKCLLRWRKEYTTGENSHY